MPRSSARWRPTLWPSSKRSSLRVTKPHVRIYLPEATAGDYDRIYAAYRRAHDDDHGEHAALMKDLKDLRKDSINAN